MMHVRSGHGARTAFSARNLFFAQKPAEKAALTRFQWCFCAFFAALGMYRSAASPGILITNLPAYGTSNHLAGLALGVSPAAYDVAVFIFVPGYGWVTKPTCVQ